MDTFERDLVAWMKDRGRGYAIQLTRDRSKADDLLQTTMYRALRSRAQFQVGTNFSGWLYTIMRNEHISSKRRTKRDGGSIDDLPETMFCRSGSQETTREYDRVMTIVGAQPPATAWLASAIMDGFSYDDIAWMLDCSVGTVKSRLWRLRRHLEHEMEAA